MKEHIYKYGIDYGTTNSSIALSIFDGEDIVTTVFEVEDTAPKHVMPSKVCVYGKKDIRVGRGAEVDDESRMLRAVKMTLEPKPLKKFSVAGEDVSTVDVIAAVLRQLREKAEHEIVNFDVNISGVVLGVPVEFGDSQKLLLKEALVKAGFYKNIEQAEAGTEFVSEPLAVAVDYGEKIKDDKNVLVFDFGGGTLDIAIMNLKRDVAMSDHLHPHTVISKHRATIGGEKLTSIVRGLSIIGCREKDILEDVVDNNYGFWDVSRNAFQAVIEEGTPVADTAFNKIQRSGKYISIGKKDRFASVLCIDIYQNNRNGNEKLGTIEIRAAESNSYKIYMSVDKKQGVLSVYAPHTQRIS